MTMQGLGARELGPDLPFTVRAGDRAVTFTLAALRRRWWIPAGVGAAFTVVGATRGALLGGLIAGGSMVGLIALVLAVVIGAQWLHRNSTITVTSTELIFDGFRRRVLPRAEFSEMVVGGIERFGRGGFGTRSPRQLRARSWGSPRLPVGSWSTTRWSRLGRATLR